MSQKKRVMMKNQTTCNWQVVRMKVVICSTISHFRYLPIINGWSCKELHSDDDQKKQKKKKEFLLVHICI